MKKTISILLALVLVLALSATAFATDINNVESNNTSTQDVTAAYVAGNDGEIATVYYVTIAWKEDSNTLQYEEASTDYRWNPDTLEYTNGGNAARWSGQAQYTITVTNKSNAAVKAQATWQNKDGITAECSYSGGNGSITLDSAAPTIPSAISGEAKTGTITATIDSVTGAITANDKTVGTITVTITAG